ncbi:kinase-like domain-containing protein [Halteromyces radiatus]|uniref:kinase-like domain-containing protein n=1 Tax=Halteromyces radiatus TaxID=101107 RepID=UPI002220ABCC|nr:kinase-like domain-containing protein [Halteromyces radiatus]KAI8099861.1 kinase-like domain-containing protein [Halteromyces radiatus]
MCKGESSLDLNSEVDLSHFALLRSVGKGAFGKVRVVQHKGTKQLFALKYINKARCIQMRAVENIISERRLLERIDCGLIVNLRYAFQDDENLFMVLDLMLGGDLRFHLDRLGVMPEAYVQFYAAEVAWSLRYLHKKNIIHRDLKPDNILLSEQGHAHLTDFNIAVQFSESKPLTSVAGSMAYMAPEVLMKRGYLASVDWWSLGVVCYELLIGKRPFRGKTNEALQQAILHDNITFPESSHISQEARDFITGLLTRDINRRLGVGEKGFRRLMAHPWLQHIQWDLLESEQAVPPFIPDSKRANFDPTHELEEILLEDNPLKVRKRNQPKRSATSNANTSFRSHGSEVILPETSPERQMMEDKFVTFDYTKPEENERRRTEMEQQRWAQKMAKTNGIEKPGISPPTRGSSRKVITGTYNTSVADYIQQQPGTPLSASDILKLEELERMKRTQQSALHLSAQQTQHHQRQGTREKSRTNEWHPPSGIMVSNTSLLDPDPLNAVQARDNYILQAGGVPPPINPPPPVMMSSSSSDRINNKNVNVYQQQHQQQQQHHNHQQYQQHQKQQQHHQLQQLQQLRRRSSSDSSYLPASPENLHRPLMAASTSSIVTSLTTNTTNQSQQQRNRNESPVPPQKWMFDSNTLPPIPPSATTPSSSVMTTPLPPPNIPPPPIPSDISPLPFAPH